MNKFMDKDWIKMNAKGLITKKLQEIDEFEANFQPNTASRAMYKWCTDYNYRKNEWLFRQSTVELFKHNNNIL
jgi:hypothetical protein